MTTRTLRKTRLDSARPASQMSRPRPGRSRTGTKTVNKDAGRLEAGSRFGPCVLVRRLGRGGQSEVWLADNVVKGRQEAVKVLCTERATAGSRRRLLREAVIAAELSCAPGLAKIYDVGEQAGRLYLRMELIGGFSLERAGRLPGYKLVSLFKQMAAAVATCHARGFVHRDLKPANFMLGYDGTVTLIDFGLSKRLRHQRDVTRSGDVIGTPVFMSPEQQACSKQASPRNDVYSLGATFRALMTGGRSAPGSASAPVEPLCPGSGEHGFARPPQLAEIVRIAMATDPTARFGDAGELLEVLTQIERDPGSVVTAPSRRTPRLPSFWQKIRLAAASLCAAFASLLSGFSG